MLLEAGYGQKKFAKTQNGYNAHIVFSYREYTGIKTKKDPEEHMKKVNEKEL